jgi:hypothetical protein
VPNRVVVEVVSQALKPIPVNFDAPWNVYPSVTTFPTFHPDRSAFISLAFQKVRYREVAEVVFHLLMAVPTNVAALGLPLDAYVPPSSRHEESA